MKNCAFVIAAASLTPFCGHGQNINTVLSDWSIVTSGNLQSVNDYDGNAYVGGNVTDANGFTVNAIGGAAGSVSLDVAGNLSSGNSGNIIKVNGYGNVGVGGSLNGRTFDFNNGGHESSSLPASPVQALTAASGTLAGLTANSQASLSSDHQTFNFNCTAGDSVAVFNVSASDMSSAPQFGLSGVTANTTVVINVNCNDGTLNVKGNFLSSFNLGSLGNRVVFNFYNAQNVNLNTGIYGYVLAPGANVDEVNDIYGGVFCNNLTAGEVDLPPGSQTVWQGNLSSVPEPATWLSGAALVGLLGVSFIRRKAGNGGAAQ
jgi:choice-of-anchor A domain-containing protein